jgi:hypothetical protein
LTRIRSNCPGISSVPLELNVNKNAKVFAMAQTFVFYVTNLGSEEIINMLAMIAVVLIVLWLAGFFAFHVTTTFIHVALLVGIVLLVMHFLRRSPASA